LEAGGTRLLFDTGQSITAAHNAAILDIDLKGIPITLSHGHYDHAGGLENILKLKGPTEVFCHPEAYRPQVCRETGQAALYRDSKK
jgi:7,8-dihydropterin-6-yl-methyl-4-(beta-D-ribofuranosyl)aminobenzene 5'-phosphate synthase